MAASPNGSNPCTTFPSRTALLPLCGLSPLTTGGGTDRSTDHPPRPSSKPPLTIPSAPRQDSVTKLKHDEGWMRMVEDPPAGDRDGIGFGSKVTVIAPPGGGVGEMLATESVTSALNPVGPPSAVTCAVDVLVLQAWPPDDTTSGERPGT